MKTLNVISSIVFLGLLCISSANYAQILVQNNTCHSMFVTAQWANSGSCTKCSGCQTSGVMAGNSYGLVGASGPTGTQEFIFLTAGLNAYSCTQTRQAVTDYCSGYADYGISTCCIANWTVDGSGVDVNIEVY